MTQKTVSFMLQRIRLAMQTNGFAAPLIGTIEVDEAFIGGKDENRHSNKRKRVSGGSEKAAVMEMLQRRRSGSRHRPCRTSPVGFFRSTYARIGRTFMRVVSSPIAPSMRDTYKF